MKTTSDVARFVTSGRTSTVALPTRLTPLTLAVKDASGVPLELVPVVTLMVLPPLHVCFSTYWIDFSKKLEGVRPPVSRAGITTTASVAEVLFSASTVPFREARSQEVGTAM